VTLFNDLYGRPYLTILSEAKVDNSIMKVLVPFTQVDVKNGNGRIYPKAIMQREVNRVSQDIADGKFLGSADHPKGGNTELNSVSHIVKKMWLEKDGRGWASLSILDTTAGKNLKTIIKAGGKLGVSTRGFGNFDKETSKVKEDYKLAGLDIVANPSFKDGVFSQDSIFESIDLSQENDHHKFSKGGAYSKEGYVRKSKLMEELNEDTMWARVTRKAYEDDKEDYNGTLEEYVQEYGLKYKAILLHQDGTYKSYEEAMIALSGNEQDVADGKKMDNTPDRPVEPKDYYEEGLITGIHPAKRAETINKYRNKPAATERRIAIRQQLVLSSGGSMTTEEIDAMVEKLLAGEKVICEESKRKRLLLEDERLKEKQRLKKNRRLTIKGEMIKAMSLGGFTESQINVAIERRMIQLDEEEA